MEVKAVKHNSKNKNKITINLKKNYLTQYSENKYCQSGIFFGNL